jgi:hypothetical protein
MPFPLLAIKLLKLTLNNGIILASTRARTTFFLSAGILRFWKAVGSHSISWISWTANSVTVLIRNTQKVAVRSLTPCLIRKNPS